MMGLVPYKKRYEREDLSPHHVRAQEEGNQDAVGSHQEPQAGTLISGFLASRTTRNKRLLL